MTYGKDRRFFDLVNELSSGQLFVRQLDENTRPGMIRLDSNENPFGPSPLALEAMRAALEHSNVLPR